MDYQKIQQMIDDIVDINNELNQIIQLHETAYFIYDTDYVLFVKDLNRSQEKEVHRITRKKDISVINEMVSKYNETHGKDTIKVENISLIGKINEMVGELLTYLLETTEALEETDENIQKVRSSLNSFTKWDDPEYADFVPVAVMKELISSNKIKISPNRVKNYTKFAQLWRNFILG